MERMERLDYQYEEYGANEFVKLITGCRGVMFTFAMAGRSESGGRLYNIVCLRLFESWGLFLNLCHVDGGAPFIIDLPFFDEDRDITDGEYQDEQVLRIAAEGLEKYRKLYAAGDNIRLLLAKEGSEIIGIERSEFV